MYMLCACVVSLLLLHPHFLYSPSLSFPSLPPPSPLTHRPPFSSVSSLFSPWPILTLYSGYR